MGTCSRESRLCRDSSSSHPSTVRTMAEAKFPLLLTLAFYLLHLAHNSPTGLGVFGGFGGYVVNNNIPWLFSQRDTNSDGFISMSELGWLGAGMMRDADKDNDNLIGLQEFTNWMRSQQGAAEEDEKKT